MAFINKEKVLNGVGKAVDVTNDAVDKADAYIKEHEIDKKTSQVINDIGEGLKDAGRQIKDVFTGGNGQNQ